VLSASAWLSYLLLIRCSRYTSKRLGVLKGVFKKAGLFEMPSLVIAKLEQHCMYNPLFAFVRSLAIGRNVEKALSAFPIYALWI